MRIIFMGTPAFAVPVLSEIIAQGHEVAGVYTRPPQPAGRGMVLRPSPVQVLAEHFTLPVHTPRSLRSPQAAQEFAGLEADVAVVVAYGLILPKAVLEAPVLGCLNLHASLLPRWRGAAPIQRAIMAGDHETGVMVMRMEAGLDTGPVGMVEKVEISPDMTGGALHDALAPIGADLMVRALAALSRGSLGFTPQAEEGVTYAHKIDKAEARLDWSLAAQALHDKVRAFNPFPGAFFELNTGKGLERVKVHKTMVVQTAGQAVPGTLLDDQFTIACGQDALRLIEVQRAGKGPVSAGDFLHGTRLVPGTLLTVFGTP